MFAGVSGICQTSSKNRRGKAKIKTLHSISVRSNTVPYVPRQTITEKRLRGNQPSSAATTVAKDSSPFVSGIHASNDAAAKYATVVMVNPNSIENTQQTIQTSANSNDTVLNANTIVRGGIATASGAVDKSGQAQFGQTNWGSSRSTIGEGQWTVPPPVSSAFSKEATSVNNATWSRSNTDTAIYWARYQSGAEWIISSYNSTGNTLDRRTEISLQQLPTQLNGFINAQSSPFKVSSVYRLQVPGRQDVWEVRTPFDRVIYVNMNGEEVRY